MSTESKRSVAVSALQAIANGISVSSYEPITADQGEIASEQDGNVFFGRLDAVTLDSDEWVNLLVTCDTGQKISLPCVESDIPDGAVGRTIAWKQLNEELDFVSEVAVVIAPTKQARVAAVQRVASYLIGIQGVIDAHLLKISPKKATTSETHIGISESFHGPVIKLEVSRGLLDESRLSVEALVYLPILGAGGEFPSVNFILRRIRQESEDDLDFEGHSGLLRSLTEAGLQPFHYNCSGKIDGEESVDFSDLAGLTRFLESIDVQKLINNIPVDKLHLDTLYGLEILGRAQ